MKAYIGNINWADEGDVFFFSVESEENLKAMKDLIDILVELDLFYSTEMYWGTNECFDFGADDFLEFINEAKDISEEELATLNKFKISGFDIFERMSDKLHDLIWDLGYDISQEDLDRIKPLYIKLYDQKSWEDIQKWFDNKREHDD